MRNLGKKKQGLALNEGSGGFVRKRRTVFPSCFKDAAFEKLKTFIHQLLLSVVHLRIAFNVDS